MEGNGKDRLSPLRIEILATALMYGGEEPLRMVRRDIQEVVGEDGGTFGTWSM